MKRHLHWILLAGLVEMPLLHAESKVVQVGGNKSFFAATHPEEGPYQMGQEVCAKENGKNLACGTVTKSSPKGAIIKIDFGADALIKGQPLSLQESRAKKDRTPTAEMSLEDEVTGLNHKNEISIGGIVGMSTMLPSLGYQRAIGSHWAIALSSIIMFSSSSTATASLMSFGGLLGVAYYFKSSFQGIGLQLQFGPHYYMAKEDSNATPENKLSFSGIAAIGWKTLLDAGINFGIYGGALYLKDPLLETVSLSFSQVQPMGFIQAGYIF